MHIAVQANNVEMVKLLLESKNIRPNTVNNIHIYKSLWRFNFFLFCHRPIDLTENDEIKSLILANENSKIPDEKE